MDMNLANKLTMLRVVMIPAFLLVLFLAPEPMNRYIAVIIFIVASLTDMLMARLQENTTWFPTSGNLWTLLRTSCW